VSALRDLREPRRLEQERRKLEHELERTQRLDSLGVLAGGIAHDFNNLLTGVLGGAELLIERARDPLDRLYAQGILDAGQRAASLTAQMLAYAGRKELGPRLPVDLGALAQELRSLLDATLSRKASLAVSIAEGSVVLGNRATLTQVVMNLLTNASDALAGEPGSIAVRTRLTTDPGPRFAHALGAKIGQGTWVLLEVTDSGEGMDEATQQRIFEPFFSTKAKGHGLGLAACLGIVSSHGGAVVVDSAKGRGSTFSVLLPAHEAIAVAAPAARVVTNTSGRKVLVVDDEPMLRNHLRRALVRRGYDVQEAHNGQSALAALELGEPHVVILDMTMPDLSGIEVLRRVRARGCRVPVILSSGYHDATIELEPGLFQSFLLKPYTLTDLFDVLERALSA
jgi:two-component system cell cycle sensor histidine kinase/response regulator CckA